MSATITALRLMIADTLLVADTAPANLREAIERQAWREAEAWTAWRDARRVGSTRADAGHMTRGIEQQIGNR